MSLNQSEKAGIKGSIAHPSAANKVIAKLNEAAVVVPVAANVAELEMTASETYDDADTQAVADKIDAVIAALVAAGLMAEPEEE